MEEITTSLQGGTDPGAYCLVLTAEYLRGSIGYDDEAGLRQFMHSVVEAGGIENVANAARSKGYEIETSLEQTILGLSPAEQELETRYLHFLSLALFYDDTFPVWKYRKVAQSAFTYLQRAAILLPLIQFPDSEEGHRFRSEIRDRHLSRMNDMVACLQISASSMDEFMYAVIP